MKLAYDDFESIDWMVDFSRLRLKRYFLKNLKKSANIWIRLKILIDKIAVWFIILMLGISAGLVAKFVALSIEYLYDIRMGVCTTNILLSNQQCCWNSPTVSVINSLKINLNFSCNEWKTWSDLFNINSNKTFGYILNYAFFVLFALLYTFFSSFICVYISPYSAGGSIVEIKTILSGFIMRGYFGKFTFIIKTLTLIPTVASGLVLGQEGPMVHICCCLSNILCCLNHTFKFNEAKKRQVYINFKIIILKMYIAGAASGVAVAFGAPIGGLLFCYEEVYLYIYYMINRLVIIFKQRQSGKLLYVVQ